jgi:hypothetical protein
MKMENNEVKIWHILVFMFLTTLMIYFIYYKPEVTYENNNKICKEDSLREVIYNLKSELEISEDGWDKKEQRYEDVLFEYEYGLERLKETHPSAYKEFHRIISFKEKYSMQDKIDNQKRLKFYDEYR